MYEPYFACSVVAAVIAVSKAVIAAVALVVARARVVSVIAVPVSPVKTEPLPVIYQSLIVTFTAESPSCTDTVLAVPAAALSISAMPFHFVFA